MKSNGIFAGGSGKIGNVVSCYRYGKYYMRTIPDKVKQPNSPKQLVARQKFRIAQVFTSKIKLFVKFGFAAYANNRSAYAAAISYLLNNSIKEDNSNIEIDYSKVCVSMGTRPEVREVTMNYENNILSLKWNNLEDISQKYNNDSLAILLVDAEEQWYSSFFSKAVRSDYSVELMPVIPNHCNNVHVYLCLYSQSILSGNIEEEDISPSVYCGGL